MGHRTRRGRVERWRWFEQRRRCSGKSDAEEAGRSRLVHMTLVIVGIIGVVLVALWVLEHFAWLIGCVAALYAIHACGRRRRSNRP
jgi:hypothetical protein